MSDLNLTFGEWKESIAHHHHYHDNQAGSMARRPLKDFLQSATPEAAHMVRIVIIVVVINDNDCYNYDYQVETLLKFNPNKRLTAHAALRHPYVQRFLSVIIISSLMTTIMTMVIMINHDHDHQNGYHDDNDNDYYQVSQQFPRARDEARRDSPPFRLSSFILTQWYNLHYHEHII